tara:strand:- start:20412 stop:20624 length:213 start_codon:yes stop_codon:yes gene_type:complete
LTKEPNELLANGGTADETPAEKYLPREHNKLLANGGTDQDPSAQQNKLYSLQTTNGGTAGQQTKKTPSTR